MDNKLEKLNKLLELVQNDTVSPKDIEKFLMVVLDVITKSKENFKNISAENLKTIASSIAYIDELKAGVLDDLNTKSSGLLGQIDAKLALVNDTLEKVKKIKATPGKDGHTPIKGVDYFDGEPGTPGKDGSPDTGDQIIDKINDSDSKIKAERIEGVEKLASQDNLDRAISILDQRTQYLVNKPSGVQSVVAGTNVTIDNTDPKNPVISATGGSGPVAFTDLTDVPSSYSGQAGKVVAVNGTEDGLEFIASGGTGTVTSVALSVPTGLTVSGSPVTTTGTLAVALDTGYVIPLQSTLDAKAPLASPTFTTSVTLDYATASRIAIIDGSKNLISADTATYPSLTELSYVKGVTSSIQTQLNAKGTGNVTKVGTPVNNQIGIWTGDGTIEGDTNFQWSGSVLNVQGDIYLGNSTTSKKIYFANDIYNNVLGTAALSDDRTINLPNASGTIALTSDLHSAVTVTGEDYITLSGQQLTLNPIDLDNLSATGTPSASTFLRGDNTWATPAGSGDVSKVGTPANNQMAVWTGDGTLEGTSDFTYDGTSLNLITGKNFQIAGGTVLSDSAGTLTLSGIDAIDATTESTIETAIDTLANLTSIQGRTVTLADAGADAIFGWDDSASAYQNLSAADALLALGVTSTASELNILDGATLTTTELNYVDGVTSAIQTQLDAKLSSATAAATYQPLDADLTDLSTKWTTASASGAASLQFHEDTDNGTNKITLTAPASVASDKTITFPDATGTVALTSDIPSLSGYVNTTGTPANNQIAIFTDADTIEGDSSLTYDGTSFNLATAKNFQIAGTTILADSAGTTTLSNIDALDATTEATIEGAIDTLANLTSIQGRTVTLADAGADAIFGWDDSASAYQNLSAADVKTALSLNNVENTALSTWAGSTNITTLGTISTGSWNATDIPLSAGGTGASLADPNADRIMFWDDSAGSVAWLTVGTGLSITDTTISASGGSGENITKAINQSTHGFTVGDVLKYSGSTYAKAQADSSANAEVVGIVSAVADTNNFTILTAGYISGLSGLTANTTYFLSPSSAGALTATEPSTVGQISKPLLRAVSTTAGYFVNMRGVTVSSSSSGSNTAVDSTQSVYNNYPIVFSGSGATPTGDTWDSSSMNASTRWNGTMLRATFGTSSYVSQFLPGNIGASSAFLQFGNGKDIIISFNAKYSSASGQIGIGIMDNVDTSYDVTQSAGKMMFTYNGTTLNAVSGEATTNSTTDVSSGITRTNWNAYKIVYTYGTDVKFYINNTLVATHASNRPTSSNNARFCIGGATSGNTAEVANVVISVEK